MNLNDMFTRYNDNKRLTEDIYRDMKNKIDTIVNEIRNDDKTLSFSTIYLGSYKTKTGVEYNNKLYDIDLGIRLNIKQNDILSNKYKAYDEKLKVYNAIGKYRNRIFKVPCITAEYYIDEKPKYHLDFPIYAYDQTNNVYYLAKGKDNNAVWEINEPDKLINFLYFEELNDIQREDYRMTIRFLKLWKSKVFSSDRKVVCPPSIALNLMTRMYFDKFNEKDYIDYLIDIANMFRGLILGTKVYLTLPFKPSSDIFYKINNSDEAYKNVDTLKQRVQFLLDTLNNAKLTAFTSLEEACKLLGKIFPDFPLPDKEEAKKSFSPNSSYGV